MNKELSPLQELGFLKGYILDSSSIYYDMLVKKFEIIETALKQLGIYEAVLSVEKAREQYNKLKALEIIKEKNINVRGIINAPTLEYYIDHCMSRHSEEPTQEQFDLLKEVLK